MFLGSNGVRDIEGNELPRLVYVSREKRPGFEHHKKAGAMNSLVNLSLYTYIYKYIIYELSLVWTVSPQTGILAAVFCLQYIRGNIWRQYNTYRTYIKFTSTF